MYFAIFKKNSAACRLIDILQCGPNIQTTLRPLI